VEGRGASVIDPPIIGLIGIGVLILLILLGVPIAVSSSVVGFVGCIVLLGLKPALGVMYTIPIDKVATYSLSVIPLFILMGGFALYGGIGHELYAACVRWLGRFPGGLAIATTAANALFGACSGSSLAAAATFTKLSVPEMARYNYHPRLTLGVIAASGTMAAMIPPSGMMVVFCTFADVSLGKLLIAGIIPGVLEAIAYMISIYVRSRMNPKLGPRVEVRVSLRERLFALRYLLTAAVVFLVLAGGIYLGVFSPTEGGAAGAFVIFLIVVSRRKLSWAGFMLSLRETVTTSALIFFIIVGAMVFAQFLAVSRLPHFFTVMVTKQAVPPLVVVVMIMGIYLFLGTFLDAVAMMALTLPILFPLTESLGINGIWFGILVIKMTEIALITPPLGLNVYVVKGLAPEGTRLEDIFAGIMPFLLMDIVTLALMIVFPQIVLWIPNTMG
jgi:tripartite ATP-independent transporter DctM subunit